MSDSVTIAQPSSLKRFSLLLATYSLIAGAICFSGWALDIPRLTDWLNDDMSIQPNTTVLIVLAGAACFLLQAGRNNSAMVLGLVVALGGALNLLQFIWHADFGLNHQLMFGRTWGHQATVTPGRFGPPASLSFITLGTAILVLAKGDSRLHRFVPAALLVIVLLMAFSLLGYLFGARDFYTIPWLSAISLPTATMLLALAVSLIASLPQYQPMLLLCERSSAGSMARTILPVLIVIIPLLIWLRAKGHDYGLFDLGTSRALGAAVLMICVVGMMWIALLALRRRDQREREADRRKDEFIAMLAHELRNPLAPIGNAISILKLSADDPVAIARASDTIDRQLTHMVRLVDDLLDVSRVSSGKLELRPQRVALSLAIDQALETCRDAIEADGHQLTLQLPEAPIYVDADLVRLSQIVSNLLSNACKFSNPQGRILLEVNLQGEEIVIRVKDHGIGISAAVMESIFDMFAQADQSLERTQMGLGIGLTLAKRLVELHGGSIEAKSEGLGKGSEFLVRLPAAADQTTPLVAAAELSLPVGRNRILIVDDNRDGAQSLAEVLSLTGNETLIAHDGEEAVSAAEASRPDAILLDIGLPKLNGFNACKRIREFPWAENTLIIALTGWGQEDDRRKSVEAGFDRHLVKPVNIAELMSLLDCLPPRDQQAMDAGIRFQKSATGE